MTERPDETVPARWSAATDNPDMWADPADDARDTGTELTDERSTLLEYLRAYRLTLEMKCAGLDAEQTAGLEALAAEAMAIIARGPVDA